MRDTLVGSRIRERRVLAGMRQAELATSVGISASYLNLIEHNKRNIAGKLLLDIAEQLAVEPSLLSEGAEATLVAKLRDAGADWAEAVPEIDRVDEFASRFPGWARVITKTHQQIRQLEHTIETLTDRLTHDPQLAANMHEVLSMVTAIRSTAAILHDDQEIEPEWRARFHRNLNEDSQRLAESTQSIVGYLDGAADAEANLAAPMDEVEQYLKSNNYHFADAESALSPGTPPTAPEVFTSRSAQDIAEAYLTQYQKDAALMPIGRMLHAIEEQGIDPCLLADTFKVPIAAVMRRLSTLPENHLANPIGLVSCDAAGSLLFRKEIEGFSLPRFSGACPKWPLFQALQRPMQPVRDIVEMPGRDARQFDCMAIAEPVERGRFGVRPIFTATMLIVPVSQAVPEPALVGTTCRICPVDNCIARREVSVLSEGV